MKEEYKLWSMLIGMCGFALSTVFFDLLNSDNVFSYGYFIGMFFALMMIIPIFTFKDPQKKLNEYKV